jgi:hypothetical protein
MQTAPFWRTADKFAFVIGTTMIIAFSFILGRWPHDYIYTFTLLLLPTLILSRYVHYIICGWHMYLIDFCYFVNGLLLFFLMFRPTDEQIFRTVFLFSQGPLSAAIIAFRNSLVYHKIDMLTSLAIHAVPMVIGFHIRWFTIPEQSGLP